MPLSREEIIALARAPVKVETVTIGSQEWCLRVMSGTERDSYSQATILIDGDRAKPNFAVATAALLVRCLCDPEGKRMFTDADTTLIGGLPGPVTEELARAAKRLNGMDVRAVERAEKNSVPTVNGASGFALQPTSAGE